MMLAVRADGVAFLIDAAHRCRKRMRHFAHHEERRLDALRGQNVEDLVGVRRQRAVIEGDDDFLVVERQRIRILHTAELLIGAKIDRQHAARAQRVRFPGTGLAGILRLVLALVRSRSFVLIGGRSVELVFGLALDLVRRNALGGRAHRGKR